MSISAEPLNEPRSEIWITRESIVASTEPSTTSVSQSVISTPFNLMFGPTISLLPTSLLPDCGTCGADTGAGATGVAALGMLDVPAGARLLVLLSGEFGVGVVSRLP